MTAGCMGLSRDLGGFVDLRVRYGRANTFAAANAGRSMVKKVRTGDSGRESVTALMCSYLRSVVSLSIWAICLRVEQTHMATPIRARISCSVCILAQEIQNQHEASAAFGGNNEALTTGNAIDSHDILDT